jgi:hypothetical protein
MSLHGGQFLAAPIEMGWISGGADDYENCQVWSHSTGTFASNYSDADQLFRREFIDPKMPGYKGDPAELAMGKELVLRFKSVIRQASESPNQSMSNRNPSHVAGSWTLTLHSILVVALPSERTSPSFKMQ